MSVLLLQPYDRSAITSNDHSYVNHFGYTYDGTPYSGYPINETQFDLRSYRMFRGCSTADFHARVRRGELLPQTFFLQYESTGSMDGAFDVSWISSGHTIRQWYYHPYTNTSVLGWTKSIEQLEALVDLNYSLVQAAAAKIYSSSFDALTFVAELADVRRLLTSGLKRLLSLKLPKNWKSAANDWLEWRYGWRQLLFDIRNINELISSFNDKRSRYVERVGYSNTSTATSSSSYNWGILDVVVTTTLNTTISSRGSVVADIVIPKLSINPFVTAWEVIPLSFVIDWFISVGKAISALSFLAFQTNYAASCGCKVTCEVISSLVAGAYHYNVTSCNLWRSSSSINSLEVRLPSSVPLLPRLTVNLNSLKIMDLLSLVIQRFK